MLDQESWTGHDREWAVPGVPVHARPGVAERTAPSGHPVPGVSGPCGALAISAPDGRAGHEIEISPASDHQHRAHNVVRVRKAGPAAGYAAVFPGLSAGEYVVWRDKIPVGTVTIHGGHVTEFSLPAPGPFPSE